MIVEFCLTGGDVIVAERVDRGGAYWCFQIQGAGGSDPAPLTMGLVKALGCEKPSTFLVRREESSLVITPVWEGPGLRILDFRACGQDWCAGIDWDNNFPLSGFAYVRDRRLALVSGGQVVAAIEGRLSSMDMKIIGLSMTLDQISAQFRRRGGE